MPDQKRTRVRFYRHLLGKYLTGELSRRSDARTDIHARGDWLDIWGPSEKSWDGLNSTSQKVLLNHNLGDRPASKLSDEPPPHTGVYGLLEFNGAKGIFFERSNHGSLKVTPSGDTIPIKKGIALLHPGDRMYMGFRFPNSPDMRKNPNNYNHSLELITSSYFRP